MQCNFPRAIGCPYDDNCCCCCCFSTTARWKPVPLVVESDVSMSNGKGADLRVAGEYLVGSMKENRFFRLSAAGFFLPTPSSARGRPLDFFETKKIVTRSLFYEFFAEGSRLKISVRFSNANQSTRSVELWRFCFSLSLSIGVHRRSSCGAGPSSAHLYSNQRRLREKAPPAVALRRRSGSSGGAAWIPRRWLAEHDVITRWQPMARRWNGLDPPRLPRSRLKPSRFFFHLVLLFCFYFSARKQHSRKIRKENKTSKLWPSTFEEAAVYRSTLRSLPGDRRLTGIRYK